MEGKLTKRSKAHQARPKRGSEKHGKHEKRDHDKHGNQGKPTRPGESKDAPGADSKSPEDDKAADPFPLPDAPPVRLEDGSTGSIAHYVRQSLPAASSTLPAQRGKTTSTGKTNGLIKNFLLHSPRNKDGKVNKIGRLQYLWFLTAINIQYGTNTLTTHSSHCHQEPLMNT
ncbi:uncharacterized protein LOC144121153 isoform X2 [Amblyomma americanum]